MVADALQKFLQSLEWSSFHFWTKICHFSIFPCWDGDIKSEHNPTILCFQAHLVSNARKLKILCGKSNNNIRWGFHTLFGNFLKIQIVIPQMKIIIWHASKNPAFLHFHTNIEPFEPRIWGNRWQNFGLFSFRQWRTFLKLGFFWNS